jgi:hypothetical protein
MSFDPLSFLVGIVSSSLLWGGVLVILRFWIRVKALEPVVFDIKPDAVMRKNDLSIEHYLDNDDAERLGIEEQ